MRARDFATEIGLRCKQIVGSAFKLVLHSLPSPNFITVYRLLIEQMPNQFLLQFILSRIEPIQFLPP